MRHNKGNGYDAFANFIRFICWVVFLITLLILVEFSFPSFASASSETYTMWVVVGEDSDLNVRSKPNKHSSWEGVLYHGTSVEVYDINNGWAKINRCGDTLYCSAEYLSSEPPVKPAAYKIDSSGRVRVRSAPNGKLVQWAVNGDQFMITAWQNVDGVCWGVTTRGYYIMADYLSPC